MKYKKGFIFICLIICLFSIASVCASDVNDSSLASEDAGQMELSLDNEIIDDNLKASEENTQLQSNYDGTLSAENELGIFSENEGTYSDLKSEIGNGGNINLTKNYYRYNSTSDTGATTIEITTSGVIDGKGAVIDMAGLDIGAFTVSASGVTIKNLTIINANEYRGAIYFSNSGTVSNCNFTNNYVAIYSYNDDNGTVTNCNFHNNSRAIMMFSGSVENCNFYKNIGAIFIGGDGNVTNCNFFNNTGSGGGAINIDSGNVTNCNFVDNKVAGEDTGDGGAIAISFGTVTNCNFTNNSAKLGGGAVYARAMHCEVNVTNCNFYNNSARDGGAIGFASGSNGTVTNCNFYNNSASRYGGAIDMGPGSVENCNFVDNSASRYGGAVYIYSFDNTTDVSNCNFTGNKAVTGSAFYFERYSSKATLTISNSCFLNNRANKEELQVTKNENNITIIFTGKDNLLNAIYSKNAEVTFTNVTYWGANGIANTGSSSIKPSRSNREAGQNITIVGFVNGNIINTSKVTDAEGMIILENVGDYYIIVRHYTDSYYTEAETISTNIEFYVNVTPQTTHNKTVNITAKSNIPKDLFEDDNLLFILPDGTKINANYEDNGIWWAVHTFEDYNVFQVNAIYIGLDNVAVNNANINITKADSTITLDDIVLDYEDSINVAVMIEGAISITAIINGSDVTVIDNYTIPIAGLDAGNYTLTVTTVPDGDHNSVTKTVNIIVNKIDSDLSVDNVAMDYGESKNVDVTTEGSIGVIAKIDDVNVVVVDNFTILISGLNAGNHNLTVTTIPDANHKSVTKSVNITVNKADAQVVISDFTGTVGYELTLSVNVISSNNLTINEGVVSFFDGEINIGEADVIDGVATIIYTPTKYGKFNISAIFNDSSNYLKSNNTSEININKANVEVTIEEIDDVYYSVPSKFTVKVFSNSKEVNEGIVKFYINDTEVGYSNVNNGVSTFESICPNAGTFDIIVIFEESKNYLSNNTQANLTINKMPTFIRCESETIGDEKLFSIELVDINGKGISNESVDLILTKSTGEIKLLNNLSDSEGIVTYSLSDLSGGVWSISCNHKESENYLASSDANKFVLIKIKTSTVINQVDEVYINEGVNLSFDIYDEFGNIIKVGIAHLFINDELIGEFNFDNHSVTDYSNNRTIDFSQDSNLFLEYIPLINGSYSFKVLFGGNDLYESSNQTITFDANAPQPIDEKDIDVPSLDDATGGTVSVKLPSDATGTITLNINGKNYTFDVVNGVTNVILPDLVDGAYSYSISYSGDSKYSSFTKTGNLTIERITAIVVSNVNTVYNGGKYLVATLKDINGNIISGVKLTVVLNGKTYTPITDANGQVKVSTNGLAPKMYTASITFAGNTNYAKSTGSAKVTVTKATPKITAKAKTFKRTLKTKKYSITLKTNQNKVMKNTKVYIKVNKKTYAAKTNSKGVATFKVTKLTKKGRYTAIVTYKGNACYNKLTKKVKITVK